MVSSIGKHYLYRHIRLDTKEPFYIGIGTKRNCKNFKPMYERAFEVKRRGSFWKNIVSKTDYEVEIFLESNDYEFIKQKEVPFEEAKLEYNNRVLNKGKVEKEQRKTYQKYNKIVQKDLNGEVIKIWDRMQDIINELGLKNSTPILRVIKNQRKHFRKFIWERL